MHQHQPTREVRQRGRSSTDRADQILEAATTLLLRWGYRRLTMEDIAQAAGIGTGTLYLHWKTKTALFETVLLREVLAVWAELDQRLVADPGTAVLHRLLATLLTTIHGRPLARALFTHDTTLLGTLAQRGTGQQAPNLGGATQLLPLLRDLGLVRSDGDVAVQAYAFSAIWSGFALVESLVVSEDQAPLAVQVAALTTTVQCTFEPDVLPSPELLTTEVVPALRSFLAEARRALEAAMAAQMIAPP